MGSLAHQLLRWLIGCVEQLAGWPVGLLRGWAVGRWRLLDLLIGCVAGWVID